MTPHTFSSISNNSDRLIALQAEAFLNMPFAIPAGTEVSDVLTNGIALVSALLNGQDSTKDFQDNKRKLASLVMEKMHQIARQTAEGDKRRRYPCFTC